MRVKLFVVVLGIAAGIIAGVYWSGIFQKEPIPQHLQNMGGDFTLQSADGSVSLQDHRDKVVLIYFGYTNCPDACPLTLASWSKAFKMLTDKERSRVTGMMVSVDPERDSLQKLKEYTTYFHDNIIGLSGSAEELEQVLILYRSDFDIENKDDKENYEVAHMSFVYVVDPEGKLRELLSHESSPDDIVKAIRHMFKVAG